MEEKKTTAALFLLTLLGMLAYVFFMPTPAPLSELERKELQTEINKKIKWTIRGNTIIGEFPIIEFPKKDPFFRVLRVFHSEEKNGYRSEQDSLKLEIVSIDVARKFRTFYQRKD